MDLTTLQSQLPDFASRLEAALHKLQLVDQCLSLVMDHICVRLPTDAAVLALKSELETIGQTISTANVNGRDIYIVQLAEPLQVGRWATSAIELPHPKLSSPYIDGWEHVEFVLPDTPNTMFGLRQSFDRLFPHLRELGHRGQFQRKDSEPTADGSDQLPNPTIAISVGDVTIKFHAVSIQEVVGYTKPSS